jgi:hypothetical protein
VLYLGLGAIYIVLILTLGILTIRNGHWVLFIVGLFLPILWLLGAVLRPRPRY